MADERKIVIVLKSEESSSSNATDEPKSEEAVKEFDKSSSKAITAFAVKQLLATTVSEGLNWANYEIDKNMNLNDDYMGQRAKNIALQLINKTGSFASTIFNATTAGAYIGGPIGAIVGASLGTVQAVSSTIRENMQANEQQDIQLRQMEASLNYTRQRAGWSTQAASIGEDL